MEPFVLGKRCVRHGVSREGDLPQRDTDDRGCVMENPEFSWIDVVITVIGIIGLVWVVVKNGW